MPAIGHPLVDPAPHIIKAEGLGLKLPAFNGREAIVKFVASLCS